MHIQSISSINTIELISTYVFFQAALKIYTLIFFKLDLKTLVFDLKKFWEWDNKVDSDLQAKMEANLRLGQLFLYIFLTCGFITMAIYFVKTFTDTDGDMNFECYVPNKFFLTFKTIQYLQVYFLMGAYFIVAGFDILYMCCSINLVNQLKLLQYKLRTMEVDSKNKEWTLIGYVKYHDFLIELR